jgi:acetyltransferase-like isoleucine patch superfamily enzyme
MRDFLATSLFVIGQLNKVVYDWRAQLGVLRRHPSASIDRSVRIINPRRLELGENVLVQAGVILHCGGLRWSNGAGGIRIGANAVISPHCVFYGAGTIAIGDHFDCGPGVKLFSSRSVFERERLKRGEDHHLAPITIGNHVTLFGGCIVSPGVTIGDGAVVAAGAVVVRDVPARAFVAGVPARLLRTLP